jgi:hypothetical protein
MSRSKELYSYLSNHTHSSPSVTMGYLRGRSPVRAPKKHQTLQHFCKEHFENETAQNSDEGFLDRVIDLFTKAA